MSMESNVFWLPASNPARWRDNTYSHAFPSLAQCFGAVAFMISPPHPNTFRDWDKWSLVPIRLHDQDETITGYSGATAPDFHGLPSFFPQANKYKEQTDCFIIIKIHVKRQV